MPCWTQWKIISNKILLEFRSTIRSNANTFIHKMKIADDNYTSEKPKLLMKNYQNKTNMQKFCLGLAVFT